MGTYPQAVHAWGKGLANQSLFVIFNTICPFLLSYPHLYTQPLYTSVERVGTDVMGVTSEDQRTVLTSLEVAT
jgi:hypothetical protein